MPGPTPALVLASASTHRRALLRRFGLPFVSDSPDIDEQRLQGEAPEAYVRRLSEAKARTVAERHRNAVIIGSDQTAVLGDRVLGKPGGHEQAVRQLLDASGKRVEFLTGMCVLDTRTGDFHVDMVPYSVRFRELDMEMVERYLEKEPAYDSAGSFHSEALGITLFEAMQGDDPTALVGLPLIMLAHRLRQAGYALP
ncbi:MAG: Maf family nucleotide pyrophosphatase [Aquisalimonadaceae bacterium]